MWITAQLVIFIETLVKAYVLLTDRQEHEEQHALVIANMLSQPVESEMLLIVTNILICFAC